MKRLLTVLCLFLLSAGLMAQQTPYVPGQFIVQFEEHVRPDDLLKDLRFVNQQETRMRVARTLSDNLNILLISYDQESVEDRVLLEKIKAHPDVRLAQFNHILEERLTPNDPGFGNQWHHVDASDNDIDTDLAWDITTGGTTANGDEIVVCVIEGGGSNYNHVDLIANHWTNTAEIDNNGIDDDGNGYIDDINGWNPVGNNDNIGAGGHGTAVSGMIGARGNNSNGGSGVNWNVKIMQVTVGSLNEANVIAAYEYPYDMRNLYNTTGGASGAFVVATNASWGIDNANPANYPVWCAYYDALGAIGVLNCGATANNNVNIDVVGDMPTGCASDYMIAVTATNSSDVRTFSGYGVNSIDLGAPGESVYLPSGSTGYSNTSGTSFASPCVAGAIALMYSAPCSDLAALALSNPQQAADLVRQYLFQGVDLVPNLATEVATGGRLNVKNSIDLLLGNCGPLPPCEPATINLSAECALNPANGQVDAAINLTISLTENYCDVETVCYRPVGAPSYTCIDLALQGATLNNQNPNYQIPGLLSNVTYQVYYTTADGTSAVAQVTTPDCTSAVPGCTDPDALNYDPAANFDDGSCNYPCVNVTLTILTDCWGGEVSWQITNSQGAIVASSAPNTYGNQQTYTWSQCLETDCYTFTINDSYGDGMNGALYGTCGVNGNYTIVDSYGNTLVQMGAPNYGTQAVHPFCVTYVNLDGCTDPLACNFTPGATNDDGSCEYVSCVGCTDPNADNYDPGATQDDGSCTYSCEAVTLVLSTDCWGEETSWTITDDQGTVLASAAVNTLADLTTFTTNLCLGDGCYTFTINDTFGDGLNGSAFGCGTDGNYTITDAQGNVLVQMTVADFNNQAVHTFCITLDPIAGCIDATACNYNASATVDDGSCTYPGCTTAGACNYNPAAGCDDGSCVFPGCTDSSACNYDPAAGCSDGSCVYPGCTSATACNYSPTAGCDDGSCVFPGCTDATACNYDPAAGCSDGSCVYPGCTDPTACNYNPAAGCNDGSCIAPQTYYLDSDNDGWGDASMTDVSCGPAVGYVAVAGDCDDSDPTSYPGAPATASGVDNDCNGTVDPDEQAPCPGDFNNDGQRNVSDLLVMLADFGCTGSCLTDMNADSQVNTADVIMFLGMFGTTCP